MKLEGAILKYGDNDMVCVIVNVNGKPVSLTAHNLLGGSCDCCKDRPVKSDTLVNKIVNMSTMEIIYKG